jgi:hypothetical protein
MTEIVEQGVRHLALPVGTVEKSSALGRILALKGSPGWLVDETVREWRFEGVTQRGTDILLYGPFMPGRSLDSILDLPLAEALAYLSRLAGSLALLKEEAVPLFSLQTDSVLFTDDGGTLFLPPGLFREVRGRRTYETNRDAFEAINHPDMKGEARASFSIAALLYRVIAKRFPFTGTSAEEIHEQARRLELPAPDRLVPELIPEISSLVMAGLGRAKRAPVTLLEWAAALSGLRGRELYRTVPADERERVLRETGALREVSEKRFRRSVFWRKNGKLIAIVAAVVIAVGIGLGSIFSRAFAPRLTKGYEPRKVVETFYLAMNSLNNGLMEACVVNRAGRAEIGEATNLFVISRVTMAYEGRANIVPADEWDRNGRPSMDAALTVYGVTDLSIAEEVAGSSPVFRVDYEKWAPASGSDDGVGPAGPPTGPRFEGRKNSDRVSLRRDKGDWVIFSIDRISSEPIDIPK